jgi:hypothetical protein
MAKHAFGYALLEALVQNRFAMNIQRTRSRAFNLLGVFLTALALNACVDSQMATPPAVSSRGTEIPVPTLPLVSTTPSPSEAPPSLLMPTSTCTSTPSPSPTAMSTKLVAPAGCQHALYRLACYSDQCLYTDWDPSENVVAPPLLMPRRGGPIPIDNAQVTFANSANMLAYWTNTMPGRLWVSDLDVTNPRLVYTDTAGIYPFDKVQLVWSPDDNHVIVERNDRPTPAVIYHVLTGTTEPWPWICDTVATSPHTDRLALWCSSVSGSRYAVIEWGGEIWYSNSAPTTQIAQRTDRTPPTWAWSPDGQQIAFINQDGSQWHVSIANTAGVQTNLPLAVDDPHRNLWEFARIQWSFQGQRLLFRAHSTSEHPCPLYQSPVPSPFDGSSTATPEPRECWYVVDARTGQVLWNENDSVKAISRLLATAPIKDATMWDSINASFSSDGSMVAFTLAAHVLRAVFVAELGSGKVSMMDAGAVALRWCDRQ